MGVKLLIIQYLEFLCLQGDCTIWSESALVTIPHCWKSCVTAHFLYISACRLLCDCRNIFQQWVWVVRYSICVYNTTAHIVTEPSLFGNKARYQAESSRTGGFHSFPKFRSICVYNTKAPGGVLSIFLAT